MTSLEQAVMLLRAYLRGIVAAKPKDRPQWGNAHDGGNYDDCELNGYDIADWDHAEKAESTLAEVDAILRAVRHD